MQAKGTPTTQRQKLPRQPAATQTTRGNVQLNCTRKRRTTMPKMAGAADDLHNYSYSQRTHQKVGPTTGTILYLPRGPPTRTETPLSHTTGPWGAKSEPPPQRTAQRELTQPQQGIG
ncbi:Hypothetical predicted protein [Pelobates cultripes]|uniref:Uncharacterized protein n=1 Tax=Pelobates cultripes TaxID=61616 RepID=A0AAD1TAS5_PELCU|nr:Hypothetical predicted protein [Pelobates cultripes]